MTAGRDRVRGGSPWASLLLACLAVLTVAPFIAMFIVALSSPGQPTIPLAWPKHFTLSNITAVFAATGFKRWVLNSMIYSVVSVVIVLLTASMAGYAFARKRFPGRTVLFWSFLATLMVPFQATLIPAFILISKMGGVDTLWGLIVPTLANSQAVFLLRQFIRELPEDLFAAARLDGAGEWRVFWRIVLPLTRPVLSTLAVFVFLWHWNDFLWPLVIAQSDGARTLTVGLTTLNGNEVPLASLMAAAAVTVLPCVVVFALLQRYVIDSVVNSGLKG